MTDLNVRFGEAGLLGRDRNSDLVVTMEQISLHPHQAEKSCVDGSCIARTKCFDRAADQYSPVSGLWSRLSILPLALMGSVNLVPIGNANLRVQDKARVFRVLG